MNKVIYKFAFLLALVTLVQCIAGGVSILSGLFRSALVFIGVLFIVFVFGNVLRLGIYLTPRRGPKRD